MPVPERPSGTRVVQEQRLPSGGVTLYVQPAWRRSLPWLTHGVTAGADMSLFGSTPAGEVVPRWLGLGKALDATGVVHARQVHGAFVLVHVGAATGVHIAGDADGHVTRAAGLLLTVSVADCVPAMLVDPRTRAIALLHAGWRGLAAGVLEQGIGRLLELTGSGPADLLLHLGPAICGQCYEVGPEVLEGLGLPMTLGGEAGCHVDLRSHAARRAHEQGVPAGNITVSSHCTRCGNSPFYSHRAGCAERQLAVLAVRAAP